jgi:spermidine/putrescine transport system substrate-binding protein
MKTAREINIPPELADKGHFIKVCSPEANEIYTKIWTDLMK